MKELFIIIVFMFSTTLAFADDDASGGSFFDLSKILEPLVEDLQNATDNETLNKIIGGALGTQDSSNSALDSYGSEEQARQYLKGEKALEKGDYEKAFALWHPLAERGYAPAEYALGHLYSFNENFPRDYRKGFRWFQRAAYGGIADAQNNVGWMYETGNGVRKNFNSAMQFYRRAAEQGHAIGQFNIGEIHRNGIGVKPNNLKAYKWYSISSENGFKFADKELTKLAKQMNASDIDRAKKLARICVISKFSDCD